jgi:hypothetical protein
LLKGSRKFISYEDLKAARAKRAGRMLQKRLTKGQVEVKVDLEASPELEAVPSILKVKKKCG